MRRKHHDPSPAAKPWVHLVDDDEKPFDQTNGMVDFDTEAKPDASDTDLIGKAVASNTVNVGFFGGGGF
ncbi:hypothetical protein [Amnibacterium sp.]|uniref:hypothetical protein n=1 Tax=Amnibacterium sp. TaxID=1872496 RepID=UPI003F7C0E44